MKIPNLLLLIIIFTVMAASRALSDTFISRANGTWSNPASWDKNVAPGAGDTVTVRHVILVDFNTIVGNSPASGGPPAILVDSGAALTLSSGVSLTVRGDVLLNNSPLTMDAGAIFQFDSSGADSPGTTAYRLQIGTAHNQPSARLNINGTAAARCIIRSLTGNGAAYGFLTDGGFAQGGLISGMYADMDHLGSASTAAINFAATGSVVFFLENVTCSSCGAIRSTYNISGSAIVSLSNVSWKNTPGSTSVFIYSPYPLTTGVREIVDSVFDDTVTLYPPLDFTIKRNYLGAGIEVSGGKWAAFEGNLVRHSGTENRLAGDSKNNYWLVDAPTRINPHFLQAATYSWNMTVDGDVFEFNGTDGSGDCVLIGLPNNPVTVTVKNCLVLPNAGGENSGTLISALGNPNTSLVVEHNTYFTGIQGLAVGETYNGFSGMLASFRSNIAWDTLRRGYKVFDSGPDNAVPDLLRADNIETNCGWNLATGTNGKGYNHLEFTGGAPGATDVDTDPQFVDSGRRLAAWDGSLGGPGTIENALKELQKSNDASGYNPSYDIQNLVNWVKAGFAPRNTLLKNSAHDGLDIGAVPVSAATVTATPTRTHTTAPTLTLTSTPSPAIPAATPTATPIPTLTPTKTATAANTEAATSTATVRPSVTPSIPPPSPTLTVPPAWTVTATSTSTATATPTSTLAPSATPSPSATATATASHTPTASRTPTSTGTPTSTPSPTPTRVKGRKPR